VITHQQDHFQFHFHINSSAKLVVVCKYQGFFIFFLFQSKILLFPPSRWRINQIYNSQSIRGEICNQCSSLHVQMSFKILKLKNLNSFCHCQFWSLFWLKIFYFFFLEGDKISGDFLSSRLNRTSDLKKLTTFDKNYTFNKKRRKYLKLFFSVKGSLAVDDEKMKMRC
jgi:hypothetical protein